MPRENINLEMQLVWEPLIQNGQSVPIWDYPLIRIGPNRPVIYRHVVQIGEQVYTVYIGEGQSLNGPQQHSLAYQYRGSHGPTRVRIRDFLANLQQPHWTEILTCDFLQVANVRQRRALEGILYGYYFKESLGWRDDITRLGMEYLNQ